MGSFTLQETEDLFSYTVSNICQTGSVVSSHMWLTLLMWSSALTAETIIIFKVGSVRQIYKTMHCWCNSVEKKQEKKQKQKKTRSKNNTSDWFTDKLCQKYPEIHLLRTGHNVVTILLFTLSKQPGVSHDILRKCAKKGRYENVIC